MTMRRDRSAGFTLVEVLVALVAMAILAALVWMAMDGMLRGRDASREVVDRTARLATVMSQWEQDLQALVDTESVPPIQFDGQTLRLTRRSETGVMIVAWSVRTGGNAGVWQRWASPAYVQTGDLLEAWMRSQQLQGTEPGHVLLAQNATQWQVYFHRGGQWSNAQSSGDIAVVAAAPVVAPVASGASAPATPAAPVVVREVLPEAVRLVITLDGATLTRDIALGPT